MNKKDLVGLKNKNEKDLADLLSKKKIEAEEVKMSVLAGKEKNSRKHKFLRREIAQILTIIREKEKIRLADFSLEKKSGQKKEDEGKKEILEKKIENKEKEESLSKKKLKAKSGKSGQKKK
jgi:ribosomal protein L29